MDPMLAPGVLTLAATPIGNPLDASVRLVRALGTADLIAAEDTRRLHRLLTDLEVNADAKILSYHEHNEAERTATLLDAVRAEATLGEICGALKDEWGIYREPARF